jgi:hypothetical protein
LCVIQHHSKEVSLLKILAKFLLSSVFVLLPAVGGAQNTLGIHDDCGFAPALKGYTVETSVWINNKLIEEVSPQIVEMLEDRVNCLNDNMMQTNASVKSLQSPLISNENLTTDILLLEDKHKQTELDLNTAETKIETLEASLHLIERRLAMAEDEIEWLTPKAPAIKPKAPVSKPTSGFIPDTPATTPHPASKKSDASKPKAPVNKPTPAVKDGTH